MGYVDRNRLLEVNVICSQQSGGRGNLYWISKLIVLGMMVKRVPRKSTKIAPMMRARDSCCNLGNSRKSVGVDVYMHPCPSLVVGVERKQP